MATLKERKEDFVTGLVGGSLSEIYVVVFASVVSYVAFKVFLSSYNGSIILDFVLNVALLLALITVYSNDMAGLYKVTIIPVAAQVLWDIAGGVRNKNSKQSAGKTESSKSGKSQSEKKSSDESAILLTKPFITAYRSHMLILTNLAILAVDFPIFPRRFAKVETWGTSIMDMGVGSFVFSMGLVNMRSVIKQNLSGSPKKFEIGKYFQLILVNVRKAIPMLVFGIIRFVSVKGLEYQEHETEYGIHWNFFITLGLLPPFIAILDPLFAVIPRFLVALLITVTHELVLCKTELLTFILRSDNRMNSLITMNKEGLFSFFGYLSVFIFGQSFGSFVLTLRKTPNNLILFNLKSKNPKAWLTVSTTKGLLIATILYQATALYVKESQYFYNISRKLANFPYVMMIIAYNSFFLLSYQLCDKFLGLETTGSEILESVNKNGLLVFLVGNLLTGLVNMSMNTLDMDPARSFGVLLGYGFIFTALAVILNRHSIYIKI